MRARARFSGYIKSITDLRMQILRMGFSSLFVLRRGLRFLISLAFCITSVGNASNTIQLTDYHSVRCDDIANIVKTDAVEKGFVEGAETSGQMLKLLYDYGWIFHPHFQQAAALTIDDFNVDFQKLTGKQKAESVKSWIVKLNGIYKESDEKLKPIVEVMIADIIRFKAELKPDNVGSVKHLQSTRLLKALRENKPQYDMMMQVMTSLYRQTLLTSARHLLQNLIEDWSKPRPYIDRLPWQMTPYGIAAALCVGAFFKEPTMGNVVALFGSIFGVAAIMSGIEYFERSILPEIRVERNKKKFDGVLLKDVIPSYKHEKPNSNSNANVATHATDIISLFDSMEKEVSEGVLSANEACHGSICRLSPVELAYLGHFDVLQLQHLHNQLKENMRQIQRPPSFDLTQEIGKKILRSSQSTMDYMEFRLRLNQVIEETKAAIQISSELAKTISKDSKTLADSIRKLRNLPFTVAAANIREEDLNKYRLLTARTESDLAILDELENTAKGLADWDQRRTENIRELESLKDKIPKSGEGWKPIVESILAALDRWKI